MSLHPEMRRENLRNLTEDQAAILGKMEMQTPEIDYDLTQEQLNNLLGKSDKPTEIMLLPPDFGISEIETSIGVFRRTDMYRDGERLIAWRPTAEDASAVMPVSKFKQLAETIPTVLEILTGSRLKALDVSEAYLEPDGEKDNDEI